MDVEDYDFDAQDEGNISEHGNESERRSYYRQDVRWPSILDRTWIKRRRSGRARRRSSIDGA